MAPPQLTMDAEGRVHGANVTWNSPFPCVNGDAGQMSVPHGIQGVVMHTMVGDLPGTITVFNNPSYQASAHFGIDQAGNIHQFGPVNGWKAWAQMAGNENWYSIEHADDENPDNPLTQAQLESSAQLLELLSRVGNFPLQEANAVTELGYGVHYMGGSAWGGHTCPDEPPLSVRSHQRPAIIALAAAVRANGGPAPATPPPAIVKWVTAGEFSLQELAAQQKTTIAYIIQVTVQHGSALPAPVASYLDQGDLTAKMPKGLVLYVPEVSKT
jgi:hypothetical protein